MAKFRKRPVEIEAVQIPVEGLFPDWLTAEIDGGFVRNSAERDGLLIETLEGTMHASPGDWIIQGVNGELYPCKPDVFEKTYEPADV